MRKNLVIRISAFISLISGLIILLGVFLPIVGYTDFSDTTSLLDPVVDKGTDAALDLTKASNWFEGEIDKEKFSAASVYSYTISIPKLGIHNATVTIGSDDLSKSLVQYPGTAVPGKEGNTVIFGHSILPIFYNPKNYMSIFSTLPTLKVGDEVEINYDGVLYKYRIEELFEVLPTNMEVLKQKKGDSYLSLITCVPPGDPRKPKRLVVRAKIVSLSNNAYIGN